jgi:hypothetical protein
VFFGVNASADAGTATTVQGVASTALYGGSVGASVGYTAPLAFMNSFWFVEAMFDASSVQSGSNTAATILSVKRSADFEQRFAVGVPQAWQARVLSALGINDAYPSMGTPATMPQSYVFASLHEQDVSMQLGAATGQEWAFMFGAGAGMLYKLPNGGALDTWMEYRYGSGAMLLGALPNVSAKFNDSIKVGVSYKFGALKL